MAACICLPQFAGEEGLQQTYSSSIYIFLRLSTLFSVIASAGHSETALKLSLSNGTDVPAVAAAFPHSLPALLSGIPEDGKPSKLLPGIFLLRWMGGTAAGFFVTAYELTPGCGAFVSTVAAAAPHRASVLAFALLRIQAHKLAKPLTGHVFLPRFHLCDASAIGDRLSPQGSGIEQNFITAVTTTTPHDIFTFSLISRIHNGQMPDAGSGPCFLMFGWRVILRCGSCFLFRGTTPAVIFNTIFYHIPGWNGSINIQIYTRHP